MSQADERCLGVSRPGLQGASERQGAAVEDVPAALTDDERVERGECSPFACQGEDVGGGALTGPVPGGKAGRQSQAGWGIGVVPGQPLVEQAQGKAGAGRDGRRRAIRRFRLGLVQDFGGELGIAVSDGLSGEPQGCG